MNGNVTRIDWHEETFNPTLTQITDSISTQSLTSNPIWLIVPFWNFLEFSFFLLLCLIWTTVVKQTTHKEIVNFSHVEVTASSNNNNNTKMFSSLYEAARSSPFKGPLTVAHCEAAAGGAPPAGGDSCEFGSTKYFLLCGLGGIISCGKCVNDTQTYIRVQSDLACTDTHTHTHEWR